MTHSLWLISMKSSRELGKWKSAIDDCLPIALRKAKAGAFK